MLAAVTILPNFPVSDVTKLLNSAAFIGRGTMPCAMSFSVIRLVGHRGIDEAVEPVDDRRRAAGAEHAEPVEQLVTLQSRRAALQRLHIGQLRHRAQATSRRPRELPAWISGSAAARLEKLIVTAPVATSVTAGAEPRYGTCRH